MREASYPDNPFKSSMRRTPCEHDWVYSGHIRLSEYARICRRCGECSWSETYDIHHVNLNEYHALRVAHGWATPPKLPPPPRMPVIHGHPVKGPSLFAAPALLFAFLFALLVVTGLPLGPRGESMFPLWAALMGAGLALGMFTLCYVAWKKGF